MAVYDYDEANRKINKDGRQKNPMNAFNFLFPPTKLLYAVRNTLKARFRASQLSMQFSL